VPAGVPGRTRDQWRVPGKMAHRHVCARPLTRMADPSATARVARAVQEEASMLPSPELARETRAPHSRSERTALVVALLLSAVLFAGLLWPFRYALTLAAMVSIVARPGFDRVSRRLGGHRLTAAIVTTSFLGVLVFGPLGLFLQVALGELEPALERLRQVTVDPAARDRIAHGFDELRLSAPWIDAVIPRDGATIDGMRQWWDHGLDRALAVLSDAAPALLGGIFDAGLQLVVLALAIVSLLVEGPVLTRFLARLSPLAPDTTRRLFDVFAQFAHNAIVASVVTAFVQGAVAALGYRLAGIDRSALLGVLTVGSGFVPIVGTTIVWIPAAFFAYFELGAGAAGFVIVWSLIGTTSIDNVVRPFLVRGGTGIHPFLVFLGLFGGLAWMGLPGLFMGPVVVAMFLALAHLLIDERGS
jgi:predicted PurR-regulated permease PerM